MENHIKWLLQRYEEMLSEVNSVSEEDKERLENYKLWLSMTPAEALNGIPTTVEGRRVTNSEDAGIYEIYWKDTDKSLYIGESTNIFERCKTHLHPSKDFMSYMILGCSKAKGYDTLSSEEYKSFYDKVKKVIPKVGFRVLEIANGTSKDTRLKREKFWRLYRKPRINPIESL